MKKLTRCPICGYRGEDVAFQFYCTNECCQNYRPDIKPILEKEDFSYEIDLEYLWPNYQDEE